MKHIRTPLLLVFSLLPWALSYAQNVDDSKIIAKYCKDGKGEFVIHTKEMTDDKGKQIKIERPSLKCEGLPLARLIFENTNQKSLKVPNSATFDKGFFKSAVWQELMKESLLKGLDKDFGCTSVEVIDGKYVPKCEKEVKQAFTDEWVKRREGIYTEGWFDFIADEDKTQLIDIYEARTVISELEVVVNKEENIVHGEVQELPVDNTVVKNQELKLTDDNNSTSFAPTIYKFQPNQSKLNNFNLNMNTQIPPVRYQYTPLGLDYMVKFKESQKDFRFLDLNPEPVDLFTNLSLPALDLKINDPKINNPYSFGMGLQTFKSSPLFLGTGSQVGSSALNFETKPVLAPSFGGNVIGAPIISTTSLEIPSFEENTSLINRDTRAFGYLPQKKPFSLTTTGTGGFGNITGGVGSLNSYTGIGIGSFSGTTLFNNGTGIITPTGNNGVKQEELPIVNNNGTIVKTDEVINEVINDDKPDEEKVNEDPNCEEELSKALAGLLEKDDQNIIGMQYELTVLKVAAAVVGNKNSTLEGMIRQQSKSISDTDKGKILEQMGALYKKHGLFEDQKKLDEHLKTKYENFSTKAASANYYAGDKRFFNEESSAFLMAYQHLNPESGIKEADVSVLWFMDKVSEKAKGQWKQYSAGHNLTNLSTRVAYYTGGINPDKAISKDKLDEMVKTQKGKMDKELLALIEDFKNTNKACYDKLFSEGENDCNLGVVEDSLSKLLAVSSKIESTDLITLDGYLKGNFDKKRFQLSRYVEPEVESAE